MEFGVALGAGIAAGSVALTRLLLNATLTWWWADPAAALVIGAVAVYEGQESRRGDACDCC